MQKKSHLKIVIIGGGSSYTPELIEGIILYQNSLPIKEIHLVDVEEGKHKLEIIYALSKRMLAKVGADIAVYAGLDRRAALVGADFVLTQTRVGQLKARIWDEEIPLSFGLLGQETTGIGGMMNGLRSIPVLLEVCRDIEELCPNAWLINFANPSGMVTEALLKHSNVKAIGLCNAPLGFRKAAATMLDAKEEDILPEFVGLNHLHWISSVKHKGKECLSTLLDGKYQSYTAKNVAGIGWEDSFIQALGAIPSYYLRYFYMRKEMLELALQDYAKGEIRAHQVCKIEEQLFRAYADSNLDVKPEELSKRGGAFYSEAAIKLLDSLYNNKKQIHAVNVRNGSCLAFLPEDAVIEVNCYIGQDGTTPIPPNHIPEGIRGLIASIKDYEQLCIAAAVEGSREKALLAMCIHPLGSTSSEAPKILEALLTANKEYLPKFFRK